MQPQEQENFILHVIEDTVSAAQAKNKLNKEEESFLLLKNLLRLPVKDKPDSLAQDKNNPKALGLQDLQAKAHRSKDLQSKTQGSQDLPPKACGSQVLPPKSNESQVLPPQVLELQNVQPKAYGSQNLSPKAQESQYLPHVSQNLQPISHESQYLPPIAHASQYSNAHRLHVLPTEAHKSQDLPRRAQESQYLHPNAHGSQYLPPKSNGSHVLPPQAHESQNVQPKARESQDLPPKAHKSRYQSIIIPNHLQDNEVGSTTETQQDESKELLEKDYMNVLLPEGFLIGPVFEQLLLYAIATMRELETEQNSVENDPLDPECNVTPDPESNNDQSMSECQRVEDDIYLRERDLATIGFDSTTMEPSDFEAAATLQLLAAIRGGGAAVEAAPAQPIPASNTQVVSTRKRKVKKIAREDCRKIPKTSSSDIIDLTESGIDEPINLPIFDSAPQTEALGLVKTKKSDEDIWKKKARDN